MISVLARILVFLALYLAFIALNHVYYAYIHFFIMDLNNEFNLVTKEVLPVTSLINLKLVTQMGIYWIFCFPILFFCWLLDNLPFISHSNSIYTLSDSSHFYKVPTDFFLKGCFSTVKRTCYNWTPFITGKSLNLWFLFCLKMNTIIHTKQWQNRIFQK